MTTATAAPRRRHSFADLYHERTHFQFIAHSRRWLILSGTLILISILAFAVRGLNLGIDFEGGTQWQFTMSHGSASIDDIRSALKPLGLGDAKVLILNGNSARVQSKDLSQAKQQEVSSALAKYAGVGADAVLVKSVGPTWGDKVSQKALQALIVFFVVIAIYLTFRFEWRMALAAIVAVIHDIIITVGVYAVTQFEVVPATVVAFLTILGYSLYDTVVVFDKVRDNQSRLGTERGDTYSAMVNRSLNQVLMRSINTSLVAVLPVASLLVIGTYVFGGLVLKDFALALFVGLTVGAYSSIFVATPFLAWLKEKEPRYKALRARAAADLARRPAGPAVAEPETAVEPVPAAAADVTDAGDAAGGDTEPPAQAPALAPSSRAAPAAPTTPSRPSSGARGTSNPRPRQQRGKKRR
ncbi:MAG TPA: protein translocase subunit SecF [Acidimicrobiia bacterium]